MNLKECFCPGKVYLAFATRGFEGDEYLGLTLSLHDAQRLCQEQADHFRLKGERKQLRWMEPIEGMDRIWVGTRTRADMYQWKVLEEAIPE